MLNLRIRKQFFNKNVFVGLIGSFVDLTFPFSHLGNSLKTLINISEGKNTFCKHLRKAKNPLIIIGSEFGSRVDATAIQNLFRFIGKKAFLNLSNNINLNFVHKSLTQTHLCELGVQSNTKSNINLISNKLDLVDNKFYFYYNNLSNFKSVNFEKNKIYFKNNITKQKNPLCILNTHKNIFNVSNGMIFPITSFFERDSLNINVEGCVQKGIKSVSPVESISRNSEDIFKAILLLDKTKKKQLLTRKYLFKENPFLKNLDKFREKFNFDFLNLVEIENKILLSNFKPLVNNFYMTDNISKNSELMAKNTLFLKNKTNFVKIY
jgi:hypothetical protein